nr:hypothetical protein [Mycoplasmopsis bovis]
MKQIPAKMKAFVVTEPKKWSVKEVDVPKPKYKECFNWNGKLQVSVIQTCMRQIMTD